MGGYLAVKTYEAIKQLLHKTDQLLEKVDELMSEQEHLDTDVTAILTAVTDVCVRLAEEIALLKAANPGLTFTGLDAVAAAVNDIVPIVPPPAV